MSSPPVCGPLVLWIGSWLAGGVTALDLLGGQDPGLARAHAQALEELEAARRLVAAVRDEVDLARSRLVGAEDILWSGDAAQAWRATLGRHRREAGGMVGDLDALHTRLGLLIDRLSG